MSMENKLQQALLSKETGNKHFKREEYREAIECYSTGLAQCPEGHESRAVLLKNRAACYLKLQQYSLAQSDCSQVLTIVPNDVKALYRRAVACRALGNMSDAFSDVKLLLSVDPKNKEATALAQQLTVAIKMKYDSLQSTEGMVKEMFEALLNPELPEERLANAAKNCAILSQESAGAKKLYQAGAIELLFPYLERGSPDVVHHILQTYAGMCVDNKTHALSVLQKFEPEKFSTLIIHASSQISCSAVLVLKQILISTLSEDADAASSGVELLTPLVQMIFTLLLDHVLSIAARDHVMEMLIATIPKGTSVTSLYLENGLVSTLLRLSAVSDDSFNVSEECRANISVVLSTFYKNCGPKEKSAMEAECSDYVSTCLAKVDSSAKREAIVAVATLLHGALDIGAKIFTDKSVFDEILAMAASDSVEDQSIAAEALALAASNKDRSQHILKEGLAALKQLCASPEDSVKVRALVGLCKLGGVGGSNVNARTFAEGSGLKLERACSKFLLDSKRGRLYKWAVEGLAFLSLDAEVKEALISKEKILKILCSMPKSGEQSLLYGLATIFVNLTNSYDKPERNPELEELGKYAGENVPKEHELDAEEFVKKRVSSLLSQGIVPALLGLAAVESDVIHEQVARVFLALVGDVANRGTVIQQGGVRALLLLTSTNTSKGKLLATQALAKIAITSDPKLSFPGQRSLEVIRPLVQLLKSESGLQQFESLMALTNLSSMTQDARQRIVTEGAIPLAESLMFEEHDLIRRAATELLCNMIQMSEVHERFLNDDIERVKLWALFSGEEDFELARAAAGGLAQLTHDPRICTKVMQVKSTIPILKELLASEKEELQHRAAYIVANLMAASKDIGSEIVASDVLEILMALLQVPTTSEVVKSSASRALEKAVEYGLIQPNPELNKT